jgi:hypothetical protein
MELEKGTMMIGGDVQEDIHELKEMLDLMSSIFRRYGLKHEATDEDVGSIKKAIKERIQSVGFLCGKHENYIPKPIRHHFHRKVISTNRWGDMGQYAVMAVLIVGKNGKIAFEVARAFAATSKRGRFHFIKNFYGSPIGIITGHCLMRVKQRAGVKTDQEALALVATACYHVDASSIKTFGDMDIPVENGGSLKSLAFDLRVNQTGNTVKQAILLFKTYYPPEWVD